MTAYWNVSWLFFRLGLFSFGGGYAMLPLIYQGVQQFCVMSAAEFSRLVALSQVTPGPIAVNAATYVGFQYAGIGGAAAATAAVSLPSLLLVLLVMHYFEKFHDSSVVQGVLTGIRPATVALLASAVVFLLEGSVLNEGGLSLELFRAPERYLNGMPILFCLAVAALHARFKISPIKLTILAGLMGALLIRV